MIKAGVNTRKLCKQIDETPKWLNKALLDKNNLQDSPLAFFRQVLIDVKSSCDTLSYLMFSCLEVEVSSDGCCYRVIKELESPFHSGYAYHKAFVEYFNDHSHELSKKTKFILDNMEG